MKRIIGMLMTVCICFGLCVQTSVSEAARWQTYYTAAWGDQCQIDLDSVQKVGKDTYRFWDRRVSSTGEVQLQELYECNIAVKEAGYGYGTERVLATVGNDGEVYYESQEEFYPVLIKDDQGVNRIVYMNHTYGDGKAQLPNWTRFYSNPTTTFRIDMSTISKKDGIYSAWIQEYTPVSKVEKMAPLYYEPYKYRRWDYKKDEQGNLWFRQCRYLGIGVWHPVRTTFEACNVIFALTQDITLKHKIEQDKNSAERAEHEFQFLKEHLG